MIRTVLIVDDHAGFRASARRLLEAEGYEVVGEAEDGGTGVHAALDLAPDLVLLDINLPDTDGFDVAARIAAAADVAPVVVLTSSRAANDFGPLIEDCGARGFVAKSELSGAALEALAA